MIFSLKNKYENNGILWYHFSGVWHFGHFEAGNTIDSSLTVLKITTFKKLPITNPVINMNANTTSEKIILPPLRSFYFYLSFRFL